MSTTYPVDAADLEGLTLDDLRKLQRSLERQAAKRDAANLLAVGFGPKLRGGTFLPGLAARFVVRQKQAAVPEPRRIPPVARVRLRHPSTGKFRKLEFTTDIVEGAPPRPVGVRLFDRREVATAAVVLRWTTRTPTPPPPSRDDPDDPRWRWGLLTVAHLFERRRSGADVVNPRAPRSQGPRSQGPQPRAPQPRAERAIVCGEGPRLIEGSLVAAGRLPGGPDAAVVETGLDRLWLSGFLPQPAAGPLRSAEPDELSQWIREGASGYVHGPGTIERWRFAMYLPQLTIPSLGRLDHLVQYIADDSPGPSAGSTAGPKPPRPAPFGPAPFGPGSSGAAVVAGGVPLGIQVAAESPGFRTGYAQTFTAIAPWLEKTLGATEVALVRVV
ncbi:hypothetical protein [Candidatus Laterigemmans baculatus]|uniref:hypothetical protein n=1 Tax=Candidatus Laterigemmans baculatus TaxID=2770505 RepID=UPI0013D905A8|nr:hypothetical protein [Candidatus Laterigemmans baculatus]